MRSFFNAENWLWKPLGVLGDYVMLSLLWTVFSLPLITLGPASAALYDAAVHGLRRKEDTVITRFLSTFRRELRQGVLSTLFWAAVLLVPGLLLYAAGGRMPEYWPNFVMLGLLAAFFLLMVLCWVWPVLSRFTMGFWAMQAASARLALGHILRSAVLALLWGLTGLAGLRFIAPLFVCPALAALLSTYIIEPVFRKYEKTDGDAA